MGVVAGQQALMPIKWAWLVAHQVWLIIEEHTQNSASYCQV